MRIESEPRVLIGFKVMPIAKDDFKEYLSKSTHPHDIGLAFGDLAHLGQEIVAVGLTLPQAAEMLCILARDRKLQRRVARLLSKRADKALSEKLVALKAEGDRG